MAEASQSWRNTQLCRLFLIFHKRQSSLEGGHAEGPPRQVGNRNPACHCLGKAQEALGWMGGTRVPLLTALKN